MHAYLYPYNMHSQPDFFSGANLTVIWLAPKKTTVERHFTENTKVRTKEF